MPNDLLRVRAILSGAGSGAPAVSFFYCDAMQTGFPAAVRAFYNSIAGVIPNTISVQVDGSGDIILDTDGSLQGTWSEATPAAVAGTNNNGFVAGVGCRIRWNTAGVRGGRRVKGTTFLVPLGKDIYTGAGQLDDSFLPSIVTAGNTLRTAASGAMRIWSRPHKNASDGTSHDVTGVQVPDMVSWLRSRRT